MPKNIVETTDAPGCEIIETPGHTPGGVCYYFPAEKLLLAGDTLFAGSVGRTDLPGGDMATLMRSLKKLTDLPGDTLVIPGHGMHTTISAEKASNPFLR
jgi:glyoxylase-like metal-dependent hydrolase (beta-lactamase superfamily II)